MIYSFEEKLKISLGKRKDNDLNTIKSLICGCIEIKKTNIEMDLSGIDYVATLRRGATINIDSKTREKGCSRFWLYGCPEFALEIWSVMPNGKYFTPNSKSKIGWTLNEFTQVDYVYYSFDAEDSQDVFLIPFQLLRIAFIKNFTKWKREFALTIQDSGFWESQCVFVPSNIVLGAIIETMKTTVVLNQQLQFTY